MAGKAPERNLENITGISLCLIAMLFAGWIFSGEFFNPTSHMSDVTFHLSILHALDHTVKNGGNPVDFWFDGTPFGFALFRGYQHLPHLLIYLIYRVLGEHFALETVLRVSTCMLALITPCIFFLGARLLSFSKLSAGFVAIFSVLVVEVGNYGLGLHNYNWGSGGIIAQLWATCFLVPAIGYAVGYIKDGRPLGLSVFLGFCTFGSHVVAIFVLGIAITLFSICNIFSALGNRRGQTVQTIRRTLAYFGTLLIATTHQWFYTLLDARYLRGSIHEPRWKFESHGIDWVLLNFSNGNLFDHGHFPTLTALLLLGLVFCLFNPQQLQDSRQSVVTATSFWLVVSFLTFLSLLCGWQLWGWSVSLLGILNSLHWHRFITGVQLFGLLLAGLGASIIFRSIRYRSAALFLFVILLFPVFRERINYYNSAKKWLHEAIEAQKNDQDLALLLNKLAELPRGRIYTGMDRDWAKEYKVGANLQLHNVITGSGLPTYGMLYYPMSLAGDVMFDVTLNRPAQRQLLGLRYFLIPSNRPIPAGLTPVVSYGRYRIFQDPALKMLDVIDIEFNLIGERPNLPHSMRNWLKSNLVEKKIFAEIPGSSNFLALGKSINNNQIPETVPAVERAGTVTQESAWRVDGIVGEVTLKRPAYVLFKVPYHPNWIAKVNNSFVRPLWVTPGFMAIPCPAGNHKISFDYKGSTFKLILFVLGLLGSAVWSCLEVLKTRSKILDAKNNQQIKF